ncbi:hypothetical protein HK105_200645 [Polyrhizophydium stewartii]|uniref:Uncharacterized protein n=1 Tax=Polyrhizophydium stewartii TaxID=2732419 RepID=A0ABR4NJM5_9FUNG
MPTIRVAALCVGLAISASAQSCSPLSLITVPKIVAQAASDVSYSLQYKPVAGCSPAGTIACSLSSTSSAITVVDSATITVVASAAVGTYWVNLSCIESGGTSAAASIGVTVAVSSPVIVAASGANQLASDAAALTITPSMLSAACDGAFPDEFLCFHILDTLPGAWIATSSNRACDFTQSDIARGNVSFLAAPLSTIGATKTVVVPFSVDNMLGVSASGSISFFVTSDFGPRPANPVAIATAKTNFPIVIGTKYVSLTEPHKISGWEANWTLPSLAGVGAWEWYCPDSSCGGPGWIQIAGGSYIIKHAWIVLNALLTLSCLSNPSYTTVTPLPYSGSYGSCAGAITLKQAGASSLSLPFGPFDLKSPLRPLCTSAATASGVNQAFGDFNINPTCSTTISLSGSVNIASDLALPAGFTPALFTGTSSLVGTVLSAVNIAQTASCEMVVQTPQLQYGQLTTLYNSKANVGVLRYDTATGGLAYVGGTAWNDDGANPFRMRAVLPGSGVYIFGAINNTINSVLPAALGINIQYIGEWGSKSFSYGKLRAKLASGTDHLFSINAASVLAADTTSISAAYQVGFTPKSDMTVTLTSEVEPGYVWAKFFPGISAAGGSWQQLSSTANSDGTVSIDITVAGTFAIVSQSAFTSNTISVPFEWVDIQCYDSAGSPVPHWAADGSGPTAETGAGKASTTGASNSVWRSARHGHWSAPAAALLAWGGTLLEGHTRELLPRMHERRMLVSPARATASYRDHQFAATAGFFRSPMFDASLSNGVRYLIAARCNAIWSTSRAVAARLLRNGHPFVGRQCPICRTPLGAFSPVGHLITACTDPRIQAHRDTIGFSREFFVLLWQHAHEVAGLLPAPDVNSLDLSILVLGGTLCGGATLGNDWLAGFSQMGTVVAPPAGRAVHFLQRTMGWQAAFIEEQETNAAPSAYVQRTMWSYSSSL